MSCLLLQMLLDQSSLNVFINLSLQPFPGILKLTSSLTGLTIKMCEYDQDGHLPLHTENKTFYTEDDFRDFLSRRGYTRLQEYNSYRYADCLDELCPEAMYRGLNGTQS